MTATTQPARDAQGRLLCLECGGEGKYEVQLPARSSTQIDPDYAEVKCECVDGLRHCPVCGEPAKVIGEGGVTAYCGVEHAFEESDWPECWGSTCGKPQDPDLSPFCSAGCVEAFERRLAGVRARWEAEVRNG